VRNPTLAKVLIWAGVSFYRLAQMFARLKSIRQLTLTGILVAGLALAGCERQPSPWEKHEGNPDVVLEKDLLGRVISATTYKDGKMHGVVERYSELGTLSSRKFFLDDLEHGKAKYFFQDGSVSVEVDFFRGLPHGKYRSYYQTGELHREKIFEHGLPVGESISYYPNGNLQSMERFKRGQLHGVIDYFDANGRIIRRATYIVGRLVSNEYPTPDSSLGSQVNRELERR